MTKFELGGQLWEECETCGQEPVYTKYYKCESCSIKIASGMMPPQKISFNEPFDYSDE